MYRAAEGDLEVVATAPLYGNVQCLRACRMPGDATDSLLVLTEDFRFTVLLWDAARSAFATRSCGDFSDRTGKPADCGALAAVAPDCRCIAVHLYSGLLKVATVEGPPEKASPALAEAVNFRVDDLTILDMCFLPAGASPQPALAVLAEDLRQNRYLTSYAVDLAGQTLLPGPIKPVNDLEYGAHALVPVPAPHPGVVVLGQATAHYVSAEGGAHQSALPLGETALRRAWCPVGGGGGGGGGPARFLVGSDAGGGGLSLLAVTGEAGQEPALRAEELGRCCPPYSLAYLGGGLAFVGSQVTDSELVRVHEEPPADDDAEMGDGRPPGLVEVLHRFPHLGPVVDFVVVDAEGPGQGGQGQVVACSNLGGYGSLRVIRSGIGIAEQASAEVPGTRGVWALPRGDGSGDVSTLVVSFVAETRALGLDGDALGELELPGLDADAPTLAAGGAAHGQAVQVTPSEARLLALPSGDLAATFPCAGVNRAAVSDDGSLVALSAGPRTVRALEVAPGALREACSREFDSEVACVHAGEVAGRRVLTVGLWNRKVLLVAVPGGETLAELQCDEDAAPRSVLAGDLDPVAAGGTRAGAGSTGAGAPYLMCAMGDGQVLTAPVVAVPGGGLGLGPAKKASLGTKPVTLRSFSQGGARCVFAASDRPSVLYLGNGKVLASSVTMGEVSAVCQFHTRDFPSHLVTVSGDELSIGGIDTIQKLHVHTVPLGEQPRRIAHDPAAGLLCLATVAEVAADGAGPSGAGAAPEYRERSRVHLLKADTFERLHSVDLLEDEEVMALAAVPLESLGGRTHFVVGTGVHDPEDAAQEPKKGRVIVFAVEGEGDGARLEEVASRETKNSVYSVAAYDGRMVAAVGNKVHLLRVAEARGGGLDVQQECGISLHVLSLYLSVHGDFILVGDLMRSVTVLRCARTPEGGRTLEERAMDFQMAYPTAVHMATDDTAVFADSQGNLSVLGVRGDAATDDERARLEHAGGICCGEMVNRIRRGSLVAQAPDAELGRLDCCILGCVSGALLVTATLPPAAFDVLLRLQRVMAEIPGLGNLRHTPWRRHEVERRVLDCKGFIDGDLVEGLLDLPADRQAELARACGEDLDQLLRFVEELSRLH